MASHQGESSSGQLVPQSTIDINQALLQRYETLFFSCRRYESSLDRRSLRSTRKIKEPSKLL